MCKHLCTESMNTQAASHVNPPNHTHIPYDTHTRTPTHTHTHTHTHTLSHRWPTDSLKRTTTNAHESQHDCGPSSATASINTYFFCPSYPLWPALMNEVMNPSYHSLMVTKSVVISNIDLLVSFNKWGPAAEFFVCSTDNERKWCSYELYCFMSLNHSI